MQPLQRPPDANHAWRYDETRRGWFYMVNGNHRVYHPSTPRFATAPPNVEPSEQYFPPDDNTTLGYTHGSRPIPIRPGPGGVAQSGAGRAYTSPNVAGSPQPVIAGFSPSSQSPGAGRFQIRSPSGGPFIVGASPPANLLPAGAGRGGGFSPPSDALRTGAGRGGGFLPPTNPSSAGAGRGARFVPPADGLQPGQVDSAIPQATGDAPTLTEGQQKQLDEKFQKRKKPREFFRLGKVFLMLHTEAFGDTPGTRRGRTTVNTLNKDVFVVAFGEKAFSKVRRFIVVSEQDRSCSALAITSHNGKGAAQRNSLEHGVVYTGPSPPRPVPGEGRIMTIPIRVDPSQKFDTLHPASRIDYSKTYNIEHNVKVKPFGMVNNQSMNHLIRQWAQILMRRFNPARSAFTTVSPATLRDLGFTTEMVRAVLVMMTPRSKGPVADARTSITSVARNSAKEELKAEEDEDTSAREKLANEAEALKLANQVVELIVAGMTYTLALDHVRVLAENGDGYEGEDDAVGEGEDDDEEDEQEEDSDEAASSSSSDDESDGE